MTLAAWSRDAVATLSAAGFAPDDARRDVGALVRGVMAWDLATWMARQRDEFPEAHRPHLDALVARRGRHEPVAYLVGRREFYGREFLVSPAVLIPRPETELLVDIASGLVANTPHPDRPVRIVDVGTGSGVIAITLALAHPTARLTATDVSDAALDVARTNALRHGVAGRITFLPQALVGSERDIDVIVSNPPYIARADEPHLQPDVRLFEPPLALFGGAGGLDVVAQVIATASDALVPGGWLAMEIGAGQDRDVRDLLITHGLEWQATETDLAGHPRVVVARRADSL